MVKEGTIFVTIRLTKEQHRVLKAKAKAAGTALSTFLRMAALERPRKEGA